MYTPPYPILKCTGFAEGNGQIRVLPDVNMNRHTLISMPVFNKEKQFVDSSLKKKAGAYGKKEAFRSFLCWPPFLSSLHFFPAGEFLMRVPGVLYRKAFREVESSM